MWVSIYQAGPRYEDDKSLKLRFTAASEDERARMLAEWVNVDDIHSLLPGERGMNRYHDALDWLGGLPYEVAYPDEVIGGVRKYRLFPRRVLERAEGAGQCICSNK